MSKVFEKLLNVQSELKAPKGQFNKFGNYSYRSCEDILEAVKPINKKYGASLRLTDKVVQMGERYYIEATAHFVDVESGEEVTATAYAREEESKKGMDGSQITGASSSYARKYALNGLYNIDDTKDADSTNKHGEDKADKEVPDKVDTSAFSKTPPKEEASDDGIKCEVCGTFIEAMIIDGKIYPPENVAKSSVKKYGRVYCEACRGKADGGHGV